MMYLNYELLHSKYNSRRQIRGIVHVGACTGEEREAYSKCDVNDVMWFEANPVTYELLRENVAKYPNNTAHQALLSDTDDNIVEFYVTSNFRSASSSMLKLGKHAKHYPNITVTDTISLTTRRFDTFVKRNNLDISRFNFLNMDVQGAELKVLKGIGDLISNFDYVYSEVNTDSLYEGCVLLPELQSYLAEHGFEMQEQNMTPYDWGDAIFVRKELL